MNSVVRVTREFTFETAHVLWNYDGPCRNVHGHSYRLFVTISGIPINAKNNPKNGMVMDFADLKEIILREIVDIFDHAVVVSRDFEKEKTEMLKETFGNTVIVDYQPTCENLLIDFASVLKDKFRGNLKLFSLKLRETSTSYAEWYADDNLMQ